MRVMRKPDGYCAQTRVTNRPRSRTLSHVIHAVQDKLLVAAPAVLVENVASRAQGLPQAFSLRLIAPAKPARPVPNNMRELGSGTVTLSVPIPFPEPPEREMFSVNVPLLNYE